MSGQNDSFVVDADPRRLDLEWIHRRLSTDTYWAPGRPMERIRHAVEHSHCYGAYDESGSQVGFARLITDYTVFAWLGDVYVDRAVRGRGISKMLVERVMRDVREWKLRRIVLSTADASELYRRYGFDDMNKEEDDWLQVVWPENL